MASDSKSLKIDVGRAAMNGFASGWYCAESVFMNVAQAMGRAGEANPALATGFCSGMARTSGQCGAVSGALMALGLVAGRTDKQMAMDVPYDLVQEFLDRFKKRFGSINCKELTNCDLATEEGQIQFKEQQVITKCMKYVGTAAKLACDVLAEAGADLPDSAEMVRRIAPCGLHCGACVAFEGGEIQRHAQALKELLGSNFAVYAERFVSMNPVFKVYDEFAQVLDFLAEGSCEGCRGQGCLFQACAVPACVREKGVDHCWECEEFPCDVHGLPERLQQLWLKGNTRLKDMGLSEYYRWIKDKPRYS